MTKSELTIYNDFITLVGNWLQDKQLTDWNVIQWGQPSIQGLRSPLILWILQ